jgi:tetratricopeptide (TPR) repeat protein
VVLLLLVWRRRQQQPYLLVGLLWFLGMLVPVSGLVQVGQQGMADRYTYLPLIGVFIALVWLAADCAKSHGVTLKVAAMVSCILLAGYGLAARIQLDYWQSSELLFRRALAVKKKNYVMHLNLGNELKAKGLHEEAILEFLNAVGMQPLNPDTHYYLADGLHAAGKLEEAVAQYRVALQLKPGFPAAHNNLGATLYKQGKLAEAIIHYAEAVRLNPKDSLASLNLRETMAELAAARQTQSTPGKNR